MTLVMRPGYGGAAVSDPDAQAYLQAVEVADNQALEQGVQQAVNQFVIGCKADGIWSAIKASCILAGARTLSGALVPLVGTAPTNNNFVSGDYNRKTGLVGNGSTKYLNSNRANNADPQNSQHLAVFGYKTGPEDASILVLIGDQTTGQLGSSYVYLFQNKKMVVASRNSTELELTNNWSSGFVGISRNNASTYSTRCLGASGTGTSTSAMPTTGDIHVFRINRATNNLYYKDGISFYSIGESLNLALLDARVTTLITTFGAVIP